MWPLTLWLPVLVTDRWINCWIREKKKSIRTSARYILQLQIRPVSLKPGQEVPYSRRFGAVWPFVLTQPSHSSVGHVFGASLCARSLLGHVGTAKELVLQPLLLTACFFSPQPKGTEIIAYGKFNNTAVMSPHNTCSQTWGVLDFRRGKCSHVQCVSLSLLSLKVKLNWTLNTTGVNTGPITKESLKSCHRAMTNPCGCLCVCQCVFIHRYTFIHSFIHSRATYCTRPVCKLVGYD